MQIRFLWLYFLPTVYIDFSLSTSHCSRRWQNITAVSSITIWHIVKGLFLWASNTSKSSFRPHTTKPSHQITLLVDGERLESIRLILMLFWAASQSTRIRSLHHLKAYLGQSYHSSLTIGPVCGTC